MNSPLDPDKQSDQELTINARLWSYCCVTYPGVSKEFHWVILVRRDCSLLGLRRWYLQLGGAPQTCKRRAFPCRHFSHNWERWSDQIRPAAGPLNPRELWRGVEVDVRSWGGGGLDKQD